MAGDSTVKVSFIGDASSLKKASRDAEGHLSDLGDGIKNFAKIAAVGIAAAGAGLAVFAKSAISAASDLAESQGKVNVVFKDQAKEITDWASKSATAFGQSKQSALEAVGTYGNLFKAFGIGDKQTAQMSKSLVELAADLASFNNTSVDDALLALRSGLSGEAEPLKKFGVALTDDRLKLEAFSLGLIKNTKQAMTPAIKAQASYALIMKDTALAQGDFARTSDGLANKTRILKARFADIQAEIGTKMLPVVVRLAGFILDKVLPAFQRWADFLSQKLPPIFAEIKRIAIDVFEQRLVPAFQKTSDAAQALFKLMMDHKEIIVGIAVAIGVGFALWAVSAAAAAAATLAALAPFIAAAVAIGALVAGVIYAYKHWGWFKDAVDTAGDAAQWLWSNVLKPFGEWIVNTLVPWIREDLIPVIVKIGKTIGDIAQKIAEITVKFWQFVIDVKEVVEDIGDAFSEIGEKIWAPFDWAFTKIKEVYDKSIGPIIGAIKGVGDLFGMAGGTAGAGSTQFGSGPGGSTVFGGGRAMGGPVSAGRSYLVGERGVPELFTPALNGFINANPGSTGGGGQIVIINEINGREVSRAIVDESTRSGGLPIRIRAAS